MKILIIEDDMETAAYIERDLQERGETVTHVASGRDGLLLAAGEVYDVLIVDRMLPELDGLAIVTTLRRAQVQTPVLFLTALGEIDDRLAGFESGGDDYLVKPFALEELYARIKALSKRSRTPHIETVLQVSDLRFDLLKRQVFRAGQMIDLQPQELKLLEYLMRHAGEVVTRSMLLEKVWGFHFAPQTTVVETHISRLRGKIDRDFSSVLIHTIRGSGYSLYESS